ncbi:30S ribosomal protein S14 [Myxococcus xanthus]|uniref:Small ribosomal subunit protein uS14 n=1 Tax=Myxococcus xanthus TaxID=34 RepID=A0AAE6G603_MYXXA|nr:30S ribosomal protein S14 [Myxococcus xanthus]QDE71370.1 30S ribosomal protein S14 [Myxococcus xanthus]QDE78650.1 30S ribosomal protein S14 [Myxococcus xanthus]
MQPALRPLAPPTHAFVWTPEELADIYRAALKARIRDLTLSHEEKRAAQDAVASLPRDSNPNRVTNRCALTGRPRSNLRRFGLSRIAFREKVLQGVIPGVIKSSW